MTMSDADLKKPIPTWRLDTHELPVEDQFATWARHTPNTRLTPAVPGAFLARGAFWDLGLAAVAVSQLDGFTAERDGALLHTTPADHYLLVALYEGSTRFRAPGIDAVCGPGSAFICDFTQTSLLTTVGVRCASIMFPRAFVEASTGDKRLHGPLPPGAHTDLLVSTLQALVSRLAELPAATAGFYARVLRDLLAAAVHGLPLRGTDRQALRRSAVIAYIEAQPPGSLSVRALLAALRLSRPTLYRLFRADGGVMMYDRLRRLRALHRDLADPGERGSAADLGVRHGFTDQSYLARLFRTTFGYSMSELRHRLTVLDPETAAPFPEMLRSVVGRLATH